VILYGLFKPVHATLALLALVLATALSEAVVWFVLAATILAWFVRRSTSKAGRC
jgi:hypothetical protein